jgi:hypothetical protein
LYSRVNFLLVTAMGTSFQPPHRGDMLGVHFPWGISIGLPVLLAPAFWLGAVSLSKVWLVLMTGIVVAAAGYLAATRFRSTGPALVAVVATCIAVPVLTASSQIYPDLLGGAISLVALVAFFTYRARRSLWADAGIAVSIAYLPWLQVKFVLPAAIAALAIITQHLGSHRPRRAVIVVGVVAASVGLLALYNHYAFGRIAGPYSGLSTNFQLSRTSFMVLVGLHFDRLQGLFFENPLLLIGAVEVIRKCIRRQAWAWLTVALYMSFVIPNAFYVNWYGGYSFGGRFVLSGGVILIFPTILGLARIWEWRRGVFIALAGAGIALQSAFYVNYLARPFAFYTNQWAPLPVAKYDSLYGAFGHWLPALYNAQWAYSFWLNQVWLVFFVGVAIVAVATWWERRSAASGR